MKCFIPPFKIWYLLLVSPLFLACENGPKASASKNEVKLSIRTAKVERGNIADTVHIFGVLALRQEAWLASQFDGRLANFSLLKGDKVKKGDYTGMIVPASREALLQVADSIPPNLKSLLNQQSKSISLFCPIEGMVMDVMLHTGDVVSAGEHIAHIGDLRTLDVQGELPVQYLAIARKTKRLNVTFVSFPHPDIQLPIETFTGTVTENQSIIIRLKLNNPDQTFRPGMRVKMSFPSAVHENTLLVPRSALVEEEGQYFVFVMENGKTMKRSITPGIMHSERIEVLSGVEENEAIAIEKAYSLKDNLEVNVK